MRYRNSCKGSKNGRREWYARLSALIRDLVDGNNNDKDDSNNSGNCGVKADHEVLEDAALLGEYKAE